MTQIKKYMTLILTAAFALFGAGSAWAATRTWTGGGDGTSWSDAANWGGKAPSGSDAMTFPTDKGCTITLPSGDLSGSGAFTISGDYVFQAPVGQERGSATWTIGGKITLNVSSSLTFKNLKVNNSNTGIVLSGGDLTLDNSEVAFAATLNIVGFTVSLKDSTMTVASGKHVTFKETSTDAPTKLLIDNSTLRVGGDFPGGTGYSGGTIVFSGKAPRLIVGGQYRSADSEFITIKFNVPADGYQYIPLTVAGGNAFPVNGFTTFEIDSASEIFSSDFDGVLPLVATVQYIRNEYWGMSGKSKGATYLSPSAEFLSALTQAGGAFEYRYCTTVPTASDTTITDGEIPSGLTWTTTRSGSDHIDGVYIKGVPPPPEYAAPTFTEPVVTGGKGKMTASTTVTLDLNADMSVDTASITFRYRPAASQDEGDWLTVAENLTADGEVTAELPITGLADETDYTVEVTAKHVIGGTGEYVSEPVTVTPVTVQPAALAPTFADPALALTAGADGASFSVEVSVAAFDETFGGDANDTATAYMKYRIKDSGAEWVESAELPIDATTMKAELSATVPKVSVDTVYEVEVYTKHVIGGYVYLAKTPATGTVTVSKPADTLPGFGETALAPKTDGVTANTITVTAAIDKLGDGASMATVTLKIRESGSLDAGTIAASAEITAAGAVELTAADLEPDGTYELWVDVTNDEGKSVECGKITVTTAPTAPTFGDPDVTVTTVGVNSISVSASIAALGAKSVPCDIALYVRESGATDDGTVYDPKQVTVAGAVVLTATGLAEETVYEVRVVAKHSADGFDDSVATTEWIQVTTDATPPAFGAFAPDGAAGDTLVVTGKLNSAGTVVVQVSTTEDFAALYAERSAGFVATDATFTQSFHAEKGAEEYIAPGETYYVRVIATKGAHSVTSAVQSVTMPAGSGVEVTEFTHKDGTVTITGRVDPLGAGTSIVHILWCNDGVSFLNDETIEVSAATGPDWTFTKHDYTDTFCYRIYVVNGCTTESWATTPVLGTGSETPTDNTSCYYWKADASGNWDGDWEDPAHWEACDSSGNPITGFHADWPDQKPSDNKQFSFTRIEGRSVVVRLPARTVVWRDNRLRSFVAVANSTLTLVGTPGESEIAFVDNAAQQWGEAGSTVVLDGVKMTFGSDLYQKSYNQTFEIRNGSYVKFNASGQSYRVATDPTLPNSSAPAGSYTNSVIVDNATLDMSVQSGSGALWLGEGTKNALTVNLIVRGKNPVLNLSTLVSTAKGQANVIFVIPEDGYTSTPINGRNVLKMGQRTNSSPAKFNVLVDRDSPVLKQGSRSVRTTYTLIDWAAGIDTSFVGLDSKGEKSTLTETESYREVMQMSYDDGSSPTKIRVDFGLEATDESKEIVIVDDEIATQTSTAIMQGVTAGGRALTANTQKLREFLVANGIAAYTAPHTSSEAISTALTAVPTGAGANGLALWKDYALGITPTTSVKAKADAAKDTDPDAITISIPTIDPEKASGDFTIKYLVVDRAGKQETLTVTDPSAIKIPLATGIYDVKIVFE